MFLKNPPIKEHFFLKNPPIKEHLVLKNPPLFHHHTRLSKDQVPPPAGVASSYVLNEILSPLGKSYWSVNSRKVFCAPRRLLEERETEQDNEDEPAVKRSRGGDDLLNTINDGVTKILETVDRSRLNVGYLAALQAAFKCRICLTSPATPPLVGCSECGVMVGCKQCVDEWYASEALVKECPAARCKRGLSKTFILRGFDELLERSRTVLDQDSPHQDAASVDTSDDED